MSFPKSYTNVDGLKVFEDKADWNDKAAELNNFQILKHPSNSILGKGKADVKFEYKNNKKTLIIFGAEDAVFDRALMIIKRSTTHPLRSQRLFGKPKQVDSIGSNVGIKSSNGIFMKRRSTGSMVRSSMCVLTVSIDMS